MTTLARGQQPRNCRYLAQPFFKTPHACAVSCISWRRCRASVGEGAGVMYGVLHTGQSIQLTDEHLDVSLCRRSRHYDSLSVWFVVLSSHTHNFFLKHTRTHAQITRSLHRPCLQILVSPCLLLRSHADCINTSMHHFFHCPEPRASMAHLLTHLT
jgi:hypothetical protein